MLKLKIFLQYYYMYQNLLVLPNQPEHFYGNKEYKITLNIKKIT